MPDKNSAGAAAALAQAKMPAQGSSQERNIEYLSAPAEVSMADRWFEIASIDHFWVQRRFDVLHRLAGDWIPHTRAMAEVGCGHGLLQRQIEDAFDREVCGFDLNEFALQRNVSRRSKVCCYDVFQQDAGLRGKFDAIFLFDVLEHITDENRFLTALKFHLAPGGKLVVNVPAGQWAYSAYDRAAGHVRRYSTKTLQQTALRNGFDLRVCTYWGLPLIPTLVLRRIWLMGQHDERKIITAGFDSRTTTVNGILGLIARCEVIPQTFLGTSLMAVFEKK